MSGRATRQSRTRWFGSVRVRRDGLLQFSALTFKGFDDICIWDKSPHSISVIVGGRDVMLVYPWRRRITSACFNYMLTAEELCEAVNALRGVTGGLEGWIVPALESTLADLAGARKPRPNWPDLIAVIPHLRESCSDLPVSEVWQRRRRETQAWWLKRLRAHPEEISRITAPWMLPNGYFVGASMGADDRVGVES